jgi:alpha-glucosidase
VADESKDPNSILAFYRRVLQIRRTNPALANGDYVPINENNQNVLSYLRVSRDQAVLVALNMSGTSQKMSFSTNSNGFTSAKSLVATGKSATNGAVVILDAYGVFIGQLSK